jgi:1,2-diacylglycerol 3-alpha-glucosyltransferase
MRVGIFTEFPSPTVQSGPAIHTRFLAEQLEKRGHSVVMLGPDTGANVPMNGRDSVLFYGLPFMTHPNVRISLPGPYRNLTERPPVDVLHGQTNTAQLAYAGYAHEMWGIPVINTHTVHLPTHSHFLLSDRLYANDTVRKWWKQRADAAEHVFARMYNRADGLVVQSRHFVNYWRERGVTIPIEVVGRPIDPATFSQPAGRDPFPADFVAGKRLLVVCRHDREKRLEHLIDLFARQLAPLDPEITLTLVGDGHDHANLYKRARETGYFDRIHFPGEARHDELVDWYGHADLFLYTSLSETFGNVVNEALWCGLPVVALDDSMGVAHQVHPGRNGFLVEPGRPDTDVTFARRVQQLLDDPELLGKFAINSARLSRESSHPTSVVRRFESIYEDAKRHAAEHVPRPLAQRSRLVQLASLARTAGQWGIMNGATLAVGAAIAMGKGGRGSAVQHDEAVARYLDRPLVAPGPERRPVPATVGLYGSEPSQSAGEVPIL